MKPLLTIFLLFFTSLLLAQEPLWMQFESNNPYHGAGYEIGIDQFNNCYILTAWSYPGWWDKGSSIIKYNNDGEKQWIYSKQVDTASAMGMCVNENGDCFVIINNRPWTPFAGIYGVNSYGEELYFHLENNVNYHGITCDSEGNVFVTGHKYISTTHFDLILVKYNLNGTKEWEVDWDLPGENAFGKRVLLDGQFLYVYGSTHHSNILVKFDLNGQFIDYNTFFIDPWYEFLYRSMSDIKMDNDNNIYVTGYNEIESGSIKYGFIYKFDTSLMKIWSDTLGLYENAMRDINFDQENNVILSGYDYEQHVATFAKYNNDGIKMWHNVYDSCISSSFSDAESVNDKIYFTGSTYYEGTSGHKYILYVTNQDGEFLSQHFCSESDSTHSGGYDIILDGSGNLICTGVYSDTIDVCMTIKYDVITSEKEIFSSKVENLQVYPNPAKSYVNINIYVHDPGIAEVNLYNLNGEILKYKTVSNLQSGLNTVRLNLNGIPNGLYLIKCLVKNKALSQKILISN